MNKLHKEYMEVTDSLVKDAMKKRDIELILIGGSVARGDETKHSDIDINFYVKKKSLPSPPRRFYRYKGKYIEETFIPLESLKIKEIPAEAKVIYDNNNLFKGKQPKFNEKEARQLFLTRFIESKKYLRIAEKAYNLGDYEKAALHLLGTKSLIFNLIHALPQRFNLPYPSFRLLDSVKKASKMLEDELIYKDVLKIYGIETPLSNNEILRKYEEAYRIIGKPSGNSGFYDPLKIKYNIMELRLTFRSYPSVFALRFIIGCIIDWALEAKSRAKVMALTKEILGISGFNREFVENKLLLSQDLEKRINILLKSRRL